MNYETNFLNATYEYMRLQQNKVHVLDQITYSDKPPQYPIAMMNYTDRYSCAFCGKSVYPAERWGIRTRNREAFTALLWCEHCCSITRRCCRKPLGLTAYDDYAFPGGIERMITKKKTYRGFPIVPFSLLSRFLKASDFAIVSYCGCPGYCIPFSAKLQGFCCKTNQRPRAEPERRVVRENFIYNILPAVIYSSAPTV